MRLNLTISCSPWPSLIGLFLVLCSTAKTAAQTDSSESFLKAFDKITNKSLRFTDKKYSILQKLIERKTEKMLRRMQKKEAALQNKLQLKDSLKAPQLFGEAGGKYRDLEARLKNAAHTGEVNRLKEYIPGIDSMSTSLQFLSLKGVNIPGIPAGKLAQIRGLSSQLVQLQDKLQSANDAASFIKQREQQLKEQLIQYGLGKQLLGINKEVYYYQQELAECKDILNDKQKLEETILRVAREIPAFQSFWQKYSILAQLFPMPANYGTAAALTGLQTNAQVSTMIQQQMGMSINAPGTFQNIGTPVPQQFVQQAQSQMDQMKNKTMSMGEAGNNITMPDFKPNSEHGKNLLKRLVFGFDMQTVASTQFLPTVTDFGLRLGIKLSSSIQAGLGGSYKLGMGQLNCIHFTNEGLSARSYVDIRAKGNFWVTGGWEYNYMQGFKNLQELHSNVSLWQKSCLFGISKKYSVGKRQANMQLLYDFLADKQIPKASPVKLRFGYSL